MALQEDMKARLIKQFPANVIIMRNTMGEDYYACPTCKRHIAMSNMKCLSCEQALNWDDIRKEEMLQSGVKTATLKFDVPGDFFKANCRKCPLSYISKNDTGIIYECPLGKRNNCPLEITSTQFP